MPIGRRRGAEEPAGRGVVSDPGIDPLHVEVRSSRAGKTSISERPMFCPRCRSLRSASISPFGGVNVTLRGLPSLGIPRYADFRTVAEAERASGQMLFGRYAVIEHHALDGHLLVPFQLRPRHASRPMRPRPPWQAHLPRPS